MGGLAAISDRDEKLREIDRLTTSSVLHGAESLCRLLRFLAKHSLEQPGTAVKEYQIATEVFGRPPDFDSRLDSTVRVQTGRLRSKLAEYYAGPGAGDRIVVEIPKGAYTLTFHGRASTEATGAPTDNGRVYGKWWVLAVAVAFGALAYFLTQQWIRASASRSPDVLHVFWNRFLDGPDAPLVVYSNAEFVGRPETGLRYFQPSSDLRERIMDHYTGTGEVIAVHELDQLFFSLNHAIRVKRGRLLAWDDAKNSHLIFVGSPSENLSLRELPGAQDFIFKVVDSGPRQGDLAIVNVHPRPGESALYLSSASLPVTEDYALIALLHGPNPARWMLVSAGITTLGTQAAVEFVCRPNPLEELRQKLAGQQSGDIHPFEALLRVQVSGGVPVHSQIAALRSRDPR